MNPYPPTNLACPICTGRLQQQDRSLVCPERHSFDLARQGYVNLLPVQHKKSRAPGDSKAMIDARRVFLDAGFYRPLADALVSQSRPLFTPTQQGPACLLDAGCGEGYYLDYLVQHLQQPELPFENGLAAIGLDISRDAIQAAARRNRQIQWIVGTNVHPPVEPGSVDLLLCLFGFPAFPQFAQTLKPNGHIVLADPGPDHLRELREIIYPTVKRSPPPPLDAAFAEGLTPRDEQKVQYQIRVDQPQLRNLLAMTPHLYRAPLAGKEAAAKLEQLTLTVDVVLRTLVKGTQAGA